MTAVPILSGISASDQAQFGASLPVNLEAVSVDSGLSKGMLHSAPGVRQIASIAQRDRGGIVWQNTHYRVIGVDIGTVAPDGTFNSKGTGLAPDGLNTVRLDYGFSQLGIRAGNQLWLFDGTTLKQITDPDLGPCVDFIWIDGYFMSTDGSSIVTTQLSDPFSVDPLKYAGAEDDPDPIVGLLKLHDQAVVLGLNTIQFFANVGGTGFPFAVEKGATLPVGCVGRLAKALYSQGFAWVGSARNAATGVWFSDGGVPIKLSTRAIDDLLAAEPDQASIEVEVVTSRDEQRLYVHLFDKTLVYLKQASESANERVWYIANAGATMDHIYAPRHPVLFNGQWYVGHATNQVLGVIDETIATQFNIPVAWRFDTRLLANDGKGGVIHEVELTGLPGRGGPSEARLSFTEDGQTYTMARPAQIVTPGQRSARVKWRPHKRFRNYIGMRFEGDSSALAGWAGCEVSVVGLGV